jgi:tetratricopeptide (TPR) repeat protein
MAILVAIAAVWLPAESAHAAQTIAQANQSLQNGEGDRALALLNSLPQGGAGIAEAQIVSCHIHYALQQWDEAVSACEQAVRLDGQNSAYHMWLGRAVGLKAGHVSFLTAYSLGKRVVAEFEQAVKLNPHSPEALMDLGEFYKQAPSMVGGGLDKAENIAKQLDNVDSARGHQLHGRIAEDRSDYGTAESEYKQAIASAAHPALYWTTLASFYRARKRWSDMESAIQSCEGAALHDKQAAVALYDGAGVLMDAKRDPGTAARLLEEYLASPNKTEEGPAFEAHVRLAKMQKQLGDTSRAQQEIAAALGLAHDYKPALEAKY